MISTIREQAAVDAPKMSRELMAARMLDRLYHSVGQQMKQCAKACLRKSNALMGAIQEMLADLVW